MNPTSSIIALICIFYSEIVLGGVTVRNGGIDVKTPDGKIVPIEAYIENRARGVDSVCDLTRTHGQSGPVQEWKNTLNQFLVKVHTKLPLLSYQIKEAFEKSHFFFLKLDNKATIRFTADDGNVINTSKENGAVRIENDVYLLENAWKNYWTERNQKFPYQKMLTRVLHEALIPIYDQKKLGKFHLGRLVIETLRLGGHFESAKGHKKYRLARLTPKKAAQFLRSQGYLKEPKFSFQPFTPSRRFVEMGSKDWKAVFSNWQQYDSYIKERNLDNLVRTRDTTTPTPMMYLYHPKNIPDGFDSALRKKKAYVATIDSKTAKPYRIQAFDFNQKRWAQITQVFQTPPVLCP